ncbi:unnamed protein product [Gongylonema pulchrum]|uniref:G_PROTEIN_RECEP_F1_2 domain-containing protein n=1 Tax=Gongylonema pulchrum TaxID=637853 RepID=A0A183DSE2_9BILA|nr:unnamed protein product [Gongylonema pulchrum]
MPILVTLLPCVIIFLICGTLGLLGNTSLIIATFRNKNLRGPCNILIALNAFGDIFHQLAHIPLAYYTFTGNTYAPLKTCFIIQFVPNFFMNFSMFLLLMIGIDRFISIKWPLNYQAFRKAHYLTSMIAPAILFGVLNVCCAYYTDYNSK